MYQGSEVSGNMQQPMMMQPGMMQPNMPNMPVVQVISAGQQNCQHLGPTVDIGTMGCCSWMFCLFVPVVGLLSCCCLACQDVTSTCTQCGRMIKHEKFRCGFGSCCN